MPQSLNTVQKTLVNETVRPALEKIVGFRYYLDALVTELDNQQTPITADAEVLNDDPNWDNARADAPNLTGNDLVTLRNFAAGMRDQISGAALNQLVEKMVRDVARVIAQESLG